MKIEELIYIPVYYMLIGVFEYIVAFIFNKEEAKQKRNYYLFLYGGRIRFAASLAFAALTSLLY